PPPRIAVHGMNVTTVLAVNDARYPSQSCRNHGLNRSPVARVNNVRLLASKEAREVRHQRSRLLAVALQADKTHIALKLVLRNRSDGADHMLKTIRIEPGHHTAQRELGSSGAHPVQNVNDASTPHCMATLADARSKSAEITAARSAFRVCRTTTVMAALRPTRWYMRSKSCRLIKRLGTRYTRSVACTIRQ